MQCSKSIFTKPNYVKYDSLKIRRLNDFNSKTCYILPFENRKMYQMLIKLPDQLVVCIDMPYTISRGYTVLTSSDRLCPSRRYTIWIDDS